MWILYNPQGFMIRYDGEGTIQNGNIHICPHLGPNDISWMVFYLQEPAASNRLQITVDDFKGFSSYTKPLEKATGLTLEQFMGLAKGDLSCFDTPYSLWP